MNHIRYVILNGKALKNNEPVFMHFNRAFRYGDAIFETLHANGTEIQFFSKHFERLKKAVQTLKMKFPVNLTESLLYAEAKSLLVRNKLFQGAKVRITFFREGAGTYLPQTNEISYFIETEKIESDKYELNKKGIILGLYTEIKKPIGPFFSFKSSNAQFYVLASIYKNQHSFDDVLLMNENDNIVEATSSNIFLVKKNQIYTPSTEEGCVEGIMRSIIIDLAIKRRITVFDDCIITDKDLLEADEVFLTNAVKGITWILAYKNRRYFNKISKILTNELNKIAFN